MEELKSLAKCAKCGKELSVSANSESQNWKLYCSKCGMSEITKGMNQIRIKKVNI